MAGLGYRIARECVSDNTASGTEARHPGIPLAGPERYSHVGLLVVTRYRLPSFCHCKPFWMDTMCDPGTLYGVVFCGVCQF